MEKTQLEKICEEALALDGNERTRLALRIQTYLKDRCDINTDGCWLWKLQRSYNGYASGSWGLYTVRAHRLSYVASSNFEFRTIDENGNKLVIRHKCRNRHCVSPNHLEIGTHVENMEDIVRQGTAKRGVEHHMCKINETIAKAIIASRTEPDDPEYLTQTERATKFGVTKKIVAHIDRCTTWKYLPRNIMPQRRKSTKFVWTGWTDQLRDDAYNRVVKRAVQSKQTYNGSHCLNWQGTKYHDGYGTIRFKSRQFRAHLIVCQKKYGRDRKSDEITRHLCNNKLCVNIKHLEFGTLSENACDSLNHKHAGRKLNWELVEQIRTKHRNGTMAKTLAVEYGIDQRTVYTIVNGKSWKVPPSTP